jgi:hypothetical protein
LLAEEVRQPRDGRRDARQHRMAVSAYQIAGSSTSRSGIVP